MHPNCVFLVDLSQELKIDRSSLLKKAKRETNVIQRLRKTKGCYRLVSTVPATYAQQLRTARKQADKEQV
jgi:hypothetical protein